MTRESDIHPRFEWPNRLWFESFEPIYGYALIERHTLECDFEKLKTGDKYMLISDFYPNGRFPQEEDMRHGRGSRFLEKIREAAEGKKDIKALYGEVSKDGMKYLPSFLLKHGFEQIAENKFILYTSKD
ncbi:hypothetical protein KY333_03465 [Candidatus Woesearchaeota archaeon]|nr:hypothetical protein [Candidatus Woesearchaeota archaeon]MBW2994241.1 hypothetical protein [Candidatus Woesearchaeota archaeon]